MCSAEQTNRLLPAMVPRYAGCKRLHALTLAVYDPAAVEHGAKRSRLANLSSNAGALVPFMAPPVEVEPINAVPLAAAFPQGAPQRTEPWWIRKLLLPQLRLRLDLPVHFIDEKAVTATDLDPHQNRFRLPSDGVQRHLRPILSPDDLEAASLLHEEARKPRPPKKAPTPTLSQGEEQAGRKEKKGKKHGGLPVFIVNASAGIKELQLSRWESSRGTVIKGDGYLDFISRCSFRQNDNVEIWAFKEREFRCFGVTMCDESPLYVVIAKKEQ